MKVLVAGTRGIPDVQGGIESHCKHLYPRLRSMGCKIIVLARAPYTGPTTTNYKGVRVVPLPSTKRKCTEALFHTFRAVMLARRIKPDILHIHGIGPSLLAPLARRLGLNVVVTHHGQDYVRAKWGPTAKAALRRGERAALRTANEIICVSGAIGRDLHERYGRRCHVVPNGVVIPRRRFSTRMPDQLGLTAQRYVLAVGRLVPEKGFDDLIEAFIRADMPGWKLVIAGDCDHPTPYSTALKARAAAAGVVLPGSVYGDDLAELYTHAGLFVLPSTHEGLAIVALEAMSYGLGVLLSDITPNREFHLSPHRYFPVGDVAALAGRLAVHAREGVLFPADRARQIEEVRRLYNWDRIAESVLDVYHRAYTPSGPVRRVLPMHRTSTRRSSADPQVEDVTR